MSLFSLEDVKQEHMPHKEDYDKWRVNMSDADYRNAIKAIHKIMADTKPGAHVITSSYIPGKDWSGTPFDPIYRACKGKWAAARLFFGQLVWDAVQQHPEKWHFMRQEKGDDQPIGLTYFKPEK